MQMNFRWYGESDKLPLEYIRQIPGMKGIISAIYDVPVGEVWPMEKIMSLKNTIEAAGLEFTSIESVPVHEDIKLGLPTRDQLIENYKETLNNLGKAGIKVVIYNFMPVFDWTRSELEHVLPDGSTALIYDNETVLKMDPVKGDLSLPGWDSSYTKEGLKKLMDQYSQISEENLWENLEYFLKAIVPVAEINDIKMAIHPDDPPWSIFGLPRIITGKESLDKLVNLVDSPSNGLCICTGSLGASPTNNLPEIIRYFGAKNKIHYAHIRNVKHTGEHSFEEAAHLTEYGSLDMYEIVKAFDDVAFNGPFRPDHGRMIWGETGKPGYGLYDRALGAVYINGLLEAIRKDKK